MKPAHKLHVTKSAAIVESITDYSIFVAHEHQQPMSPKHIEAITASMRAHGWWPSKPITVYRRSDGKLVIIDGHHRFHAAQILGIAILYVIEPASHSDNIGQMGLLVRVWSSLSFAKMYAEKGNEHYAKLLAYTQRGLPMKQVASLLIGESAGSNNASGLIKNGSFKIKTTKSVDAIMGTFETIGEQVPVIKSRVFVEALSLCLFVPEFDIYTFHIRALNNPRGFDKCVTRDQALKNIEEIYNFRAREKIELANMAQKAKEERGLGVRNSNGSGAGATK